MAARSAALSATLCQRREVTLDAGLFGVSQIAGIPRTHAEQRTASSQFSVLPNTLVGGTLAYCVNAHPEMFAERMSSKTVIPSQTVSDPARSIQRAPRVIVGRPSTK
jgi:hypothetical protein